MFCICRSVRTGKEHLFEWKYGIHAVPYGVFDIPLQKSRCCSSNSTLTIEYRFGVLGVPFERMFDCCSSNETTNQIKRPRRTVGESEYIMRNSNAVATTNTANTSIANTSVLSEYISNLGYESARLDRNENGKIEFSNTYEKEGVEIHDTFEVSEENAKPFDVLAVMADLDSAKLPLTCVKLVEIEKMEIHKDLGYKSFGQFAVSSLKQFKNITDNQVRQYLNVGKVFFKEDCEMPTFRKEWLKGVSVTTLCKLISFYNAFCKSKFVDGDIDHDSALDLFYTEYIENGKLKLKNRTTSEVIEQLKKLAGKDTKGKSKDKDSKGKDKDSNNDNATPLETLQSSLVAYANAPDSVKELVDKCNELLTAIENLSK